MASKMIHIPLSPLDHLAPPVHPPGVVYFGIKPGVSDAEVFAHLKEGLYRTFLQQPWFNGKIYRQSIYTPGGKHGQLEIRYNPNVDDSDRPRCYQLRMNHLRGAISYEELKRRGFPVDVFQDEELSWVSLSYRNANLDAGVEVVAAQANFIPGACLLTISVNHAACDATGMAVFYKLWSSHCQNLSLESKGRFEAVSIMPEEVFDRSLLERVWTRGRTGHSVADVHPATWQLIGLEPPQNINQDCLRTLRNMKAPLRKESMTSRIFYMSPATFTRLRAESNEELGTTDLSGNDALMALLWRSLMNARISRYRYEGLKVDMDSLVELQVVHDARPDFSQDVHPFYAGNCIFHHRPTISIQGLIGLGSSIARVAQAIRISSRDVNHETALDAYMLLKNMPDYSCLQPPRYVTLDNTWLMSSMLQLQEDNTNFGSHIFTNGGYAEGSRPLVGNRNRSQVPACYVLPRKKYGGIEFILSLFEDEWPFFLEGEEFGRNAFLLA